MADLKTSIESAEKGLTDSKFAIADKDLPIVEAKDVKLDVSAVEVLKPEELKSIMDTWASSQRTNEQLLFLIKMCPEKVNRLTALKNTPYQIGEPARDFVSIDAKIERLKEQYAICLKEMEGRRTVAIAKIDAEPIEEPVR